MTLLESLNKKFIEGYSKLIADMNVNIYLSPKNDAGNYESPTVAITAGGGARMKKDTELPTPAQVLVEVKELEAFEIVYRLVLPRPELEIADKNPAYFKYFFNKVMEKALSNYATTVGGADQLRFGSHYVKVELLNFVRPGTMIVDDSDYFELRFSGSWSSDQEISKG